MRISFGFHYCPWSNVMSLLSENNWIGCNRIQQPWSNLSDSDAWAKAFYGLIESSVARWCDSLVDSQREERTVHILYSPQGIHQSWKKNKKMLLLVFFCILSCCLSLSKPTSTGSHKSFLSRSLCHSTHRSIFLCYAVTLLWLISTHIPILRLSVFLVYFLSSSLNMLWKALSQYLQKALFNPLYAIYRNCAVQISHAVAKRSCCHITIINSREHIQDYSYFTKYNKPLGWCSHSKWVKSEPKTYKITIPDKGQVAIGFAASLWRHLYHDGEGKQSGIVAMVMDATCSILKSMFIKMHKLSQHH